MHRAHRRQQLVLGGGALYVLLSLPFIRAYVFEHITNLHFSLLFFVESHVALASLKLQIFLLSPSNLKNNNNKQKHKTRQVRLKSSFQKKILTFQHR